MCLAVGVSLWRLGRGAGGQLFRKEAMAVVALSWIMATVLGGLPYWFSGTLRAPRTPMSLVDAMFESQSGFSTTGATVLAELEDPEMVPRCILFWRSSTHYLGGLGIIVLFVAILGQGSAGKALMRAEMPGPSHSSPQARTQHTAWVLFLIYNGLNAALVLALWMQRVPLFDAICHAFGAIATGGFSTYNASVGHFATDPRLNSVIIELTIVVFMIVAGTNFMLLYWLLVRKPGKLFRDVEWRTYLAILAGATLLVLVAGLVHGDFDRYGTSEAAIEGPGPITALMPDDEAFIGFTTTYPDLTETLRADFDALDAVLSYHVIDGALSAADIGAVTELATLQGEPITVEVIDDAVVFNGGQGSIKLADLEASNGVVHILDGILLPPSIAADAS